MLLKLVNRAQALLIIVIVPILVGATAVSYDYLMASSDDANLHLVVRRLEWFQGVEETDEAAEGRLYGARQAWQMFLQEPVIGRGLGVTTLEAVVQEGPHNMYLMLMAEQGFLGLALYLTLIAIVGRHGRRLARTAVDQEGRDIGNATVLYAAFLATGGFFTHNLLEEAQSIFVLAFIAAAVMNAPRVETWVSRPTGDFPHRERIAGARPRLGQP
jgi:O-antigen ligase